MLLIAVYTDRQRTPSIVVAILAGGRIPKNLFAARMATSLPGTPDGADFVAGGNALSATKALRCCLCIRLYLERRRVDS